MLFSKEKGGGQFVKQTIYVGEQQDEMRIDKYLSSVCEQLSRSYIQKLLKSGQVRAACKSKLCGRGGGSYFT